MFILVFMGADPAQQDTITKAPTSGKVAKGLTGCGGCGCLFGLTALLAGGVMLAWGATDSKVDELVGPGALVLVLGITIGFFALAVLIGGIVALRKARAAPEQPQAPDSPPAAPVPVDSGPPPGPTSPRTPPGAPPPGPPPEW